MREKTTNFQMELMNIEKLKSDSTNASLHLADDGDSILFNADCMDILPHIPDKSVQLILADDNTMGVGTTCLGAKELNRKFIGIEKESNYYELAVSRIFK